MTKLRHGNPGEPTERMTRMFPISFDRFTDEDFAKLDLSNVPWWVDELREAEASARRLRHRLLETVEPSAGRPCQGCGETMTGRTDRKFCSAACRQRAYRSRYGSKS